MMGFGQDGGMSDVFLLECHFTFFTSFGCPKGHY
jgi:hypothetical protein